MLDFVYLYINDFKILKILNKLSKFFTIFHWETSQARPPTLQRLYDVSRGQNRYVTLPLLTWLLFEFNKFPDNKYYNNSHALYDQWDQSCDKVVVLTSLIQ